MKQPPQRPRPEPKDPEWVLPVCGGNWDLADQLDPPDGEVDAAAHTLDPMVLLGEWFE